MKDYNRLCFYGLLFLGIFVLISSVSSFYSGFHNVDLVFNEQYLLAKQGKTIDSIYDQYNSKGDTISLIDLYVVGHEQMKRGFYCSIVGSFLLGFSLWNLLKDE